MNDALIDCITLLGLTSRRAPMTADTADVRVLLEAAPHEGFVALLGAAIDEGVIVVDEPSMAAVDAAWAEAMARCVQLDILLRDVSLHLTAAGIDHRALKGAAVATLDEMQPAWRTYSDVDVLVPDGRLIAAARVLAGLGWRPLVQPVSERWAERFAKSLTLVGPNGAQIDLHRRLAPGVLGERVDPSVLFATGQPVLVGDTPVLALDRPHRFLHACYHASLGGVRGARHRRDILLLARSVTVADVAARWGQGWSPAVVAAALQFASPLGTELPDEWNDWRRSTALAPADEALLATYTGGFGDQAGASVRARRGWGAVQYAWPLLWPSRAHLRSRGRSRAGHLRSLARPRVWRAVVRRA